jgi:hypothetical protein
MDGKSFQGQSSQSIGRVSNALLIAFRCQMRIETGHVPGRPANAADLHSGFDPERSGRSSRAD